jgi:Holliday junction resolvasome RuvABC endonuclease subunit
MKNAGSPAPPLSPPSGTSWRSAGAGTRPASDGGGEYVWAVDPAVSRQAFAFAPVDGAEIEVETCHTDSEAREGQRLGWLDRQIRIYARQRAAEFPPAVVWVEQPSGRFRNLSLVYATGVLQAALFETLGVPVWTIPSSTWKQRTVGAGNASKAHVAAWVLAQGANVGGQDEADAYAIAAAGRAMLNAGAWSAAA